MLTETCLAGAFAPSLLMTFLLAFALFLPIDRLVARSGIDDLAWHAALARFGLFLCLFSCLALTT